MSVFIGLATVCPSAVCPSVHPSVRLSVCLSNAWTATKRDEDLSRFLYYTKDHFCLVIREAERLAAGDPFYLKFWVNRGPVEAKSTILNRYSLVAPRPYKHLRKKVQLTY